MGFKYQEVNIFCSHSFLRFKNTASKANERTAKLNATTGAKSQTLCLIFFFAPCSLSAWLFGVLLTYFSWLCFSFPVETQAILPVGLAGKLTEMLLFQPAALWHTTENLASWIELAQEVVSKGVESGEKASADNYVFGHTIKISPKSCKLH